MPEEIYIKRAKRLVSTLESKIYFSAAIGAYDQKLSEIQTELIAAGIPDAEAKKQSVKAILSCLHDVMRNAQPLVERLINDRLDSGVISNADQARKSAAGNIFQQMFAYSIAKNVLYGNITAHIIVTTSVADIIDKYASITVDNDIQKPDSDVIVYSEEESSPILNFSCKTSCRERAGQTYKWKLLCDLATCKCEHREGNASCPATKYNLAYTPVRDIQMCFVTADFYNELTNPQISAMFNFFDNAYVAKNIAPNATIKTLDCVIDDINTIYNN